MNSFNPISKLNSLTPRDLVRKHIMDRNHIITEEEFRTLRIGVEAEDDKIISLQAHFLEDEIKHSRLSQHN